MALFKEELRVSKWKRVAKFRLRNEMRSGKYWKREKERRCKTWEVAEEEWKHV